MLNLYTILSIENDTLDTVLLNVSTVIAHHEKSKKFDNFYRKNEEIYWNIKSRTNVRPIDDEYNLTVV